VKSERQLRSEIVTICRMLSERGFIAATDGNVSVRMPGPGGTSRLLITPSGLHKGFIGEDDIILCDMTGRKVRGRLNPSSELLMHLKAYELRPDIGAVVHAHPPLSTAFSVAGVSLAKCVLPEVVLTMGSIPTTAYATPCSAEGPEAIKGLIADHDALVLDRHGTLTVGKDVFCAYGLLEKVEHTAKVTLTARLLGRLTLLTADELERLKPYSPDRVARAQSDPHCTGCGGCGKTGRGSPPPGVDREELARIAAEELTREIEAAVLK
jgi:L-fuculose-phosphate aldolase